MCATTIGGWSRIDGGHWKAKSKKPNKKPREKSTQIATIASAVASKVQPFYYHFCSQRKEHVCLCLCMSICGGGVCGCVSVLCVCGCLPKEKVQKSINVRKRQFVATGERLRRSFGSRRWRSYHSWLSKNPFQQSASLCTLIYFIPRVQALRLKLMILSKQKPFLSMKSNACGNLLKDMFFPESDWIYLSREVFDLILFGFFIKHVSWWGKI